MVRSIFCSLVRTVRPIAAVALLLALQARLTAAAPLAGKKVGGTHAPAKADLPTIARTVAHEFSPPDNRQIAAARQALKQIALRMDQYLAAQGPVGAGWREFLLWPALGAQLESPNPPDPQVLLKIARRCESSESAFRDPICREAKQALRSAARTVLLAGTTSDEVDAQLVALAAALEVAGDPTEQFSDSIAAGLTWLEQRGLAGELTAQVRRHYCQPNLWLAVSDDVIASTIDTQVATSADFSDVILGTTYTGRSLTRGDLRLRLVPDAEKISVQLAYQFVVSSNATGVADRVRVESQATTAIGGDKRLTIDAAGVVLHPATASASTNSQINDISSGRRFGRRAVTQGVYDGQAATEREVARRAESQMKDNLDRQAAEAIDPALRQLRQDVWNRLLAGGATPRDIRCRTTDSFAYLSLVQAGEGQLAAPARPRWLNAKADLMLYAHQSLFENLAAGTLGGRTWHEANWEREWKAAFGSVPAGLQVADSDNPWSVTFSRTQPVSVRFAEDALVLTLRADRFAVGQTEYPGMSVTARYERDANAAWQRAERLEIASLDADEKSGARQQVFRTMLRKRFDPIFPSQIELTSLELPSSAKTPRRLRVEQVRAEQGWLSFQGILEQPSKVSSQQQSRP